MAGDVPAPPRRPDPVQQAALARPHRAQAGTVGLRGHPRRTRETGTSPARYVEWARVDAARRLLESTDVPVAVVARACGFGTAETLRRALQRRLGIAPGQHRDRFRTSIVRDQETA